MLRKGKFYAIFFILALCVVLFFAGSQYSHKQYLLYDKQKNVRDLKKVNIGESKEGVPTDAHLTSPRVEKILQKTRAKIKSELFPYNMSDFGVSRLEDLLMEAGGKPKRSIILATWSSGSTFLGEILNSIPGVFYHYEPLKKYEIVQIRGPPLSIPAMSTIKDMFACNFSNLTNYFEYGKKLLSQFNHNTRLWEHCKYDNSLCFDAEFTGRLCKLFPIQSMKVVRLSLKPVEELLDDERFDNVKVILLIRDPRGVMHSRRKYRGFFCDPSPDCYYPDRLCGDMVKDYVAATRVQQKHPNRLMVVRYEELALNPYDETDRILNFLGLKATRSLKEYLQSHTNVEYAATSTFRVSRGVPYKWKEGFDFNTVDEIQKDCKKAMNLWGYRMAHNKTHMASNQFIPLMNYEITL